jgi:aquaporin Z
MRRYAAEAIGTFAVVFMGCGAALVGAGRIGDAGVALAFGLALAAMMLALGSISGATCNPAVTVAMAIAGRLPARDVAPYIAAQLGGGTAGAALVLAMAGGRPGGAPLAAQALANGYGRLSPGFYDLSAALIAEVVLTGLFTLVVLGASKPHETAGAQPPPSYSGRAVAGLGSLAGAGPLGSTGLVAALAAGGSYALIHLVGLPVTKMAANPARALGPALFAGGEALAQVWVFLAAPVAGAALAAFVYRALYGAASPQSAPPAGTSEKRAQP